MKDKKIDWNYFLVYLGLALFFISCVVGWVAHVIYCLMGAKYLLLIVGAIVAPVGIIHGIGILFGVDW